DQLRHRKRVVTVDRGELWQIGQSPPRRTIHHSAVQSHHARDRCKERALACPVCPNNGGQAAGSELSAHGLQRYSPPIAHGYVAQQDAAISKATPLAIWSDGQVERPRRRPQTVSNARVE